MRFSVSSPILAAAGHVVLRYVKESSGRPAAPCRLILAQGAPPRVALLWSRRPESASGPSVTMIKDLIVNLSSRPIRDVAGDFACSIASAFSAHVAAIAFVYETGPGGAHDGQHLADVLDTLRRESRGAAAQTIETFDLFARRAGLSAELHAVDATFLGASDYFARAARRFDLSVVGQSEPEGRAAEELIAEAALFDSGRPVVVVPYIQRTGLKLGRVMVCWDASRNAARAVADAMPFLLRAGRIDIVMVTQDGGAGDEMAGADIAQHLARHGLDVEVQRIISRELDVANAILVARRRLVSRFHDHGRLWTLAAARVHPRRRHPRSSDRDDRPDTAVALIAPRSLRRVGKIALSVRERWARRVSDFPSPPESARPRGQVVLRAVPTRRPGRCAEPLPDARPCSAARCAP